MNLEGTLSNPVHMLTKQTSGLPHALLNEPPYQEHMPPVNDWYQLANQVTPTKIAQIWHSGL